jgi:hypothetical protein
MSIGKMTIALKTKMTNMSVLNSKSHRIKKEVKSNKRKAIIFKVIGKQKISFPMFEGF